MSIRIAGRISAAKILPEFLSQLVSRAFVTLGGTFGGVWPTEIRLGNLLKSMQFASRLMANHRENSMNLLNFFSTIRRFQSPRRRVQANRRQFSDGQQLEARVLPATLVNPTTLTYQDIDGDDVSVTLLNPILTAGNVNSIFVFNTGNVNGSNNVPQQLRSIKLSGTAAAAGTTITTVATRNPVKGGDGFAAVGQINATGRDLGAVVIDGDLGRILAGDATTATTGVTDMTVYSMGRYGTVTGAVDLNSTIRGTLGSLIVQADIKGAFVNVIGGADGKVDTLTIGGSMIGNSSANSGRVHSTGNMGKVTVAGDVIGGGGTHSGAITTFGNIVSVAVGGSLIGGSSTFAGTILSDYLGGGPKPDEVGGHIGPVSIGRDVLGGSDTGAGSIISESGRLGNVTIGGSLLAGSANRSAHIHANLEMGAVSIGGSVIGGAGIQSGQIESMLTIGNVAIGGSLKGGGGDKSGQVFAASDLGNILIGRNLVGAHGKDSGQVLCGRDMGSVTIKGSIRGGTNDWSGRVYAGGEMGAVRITGDVVGGDGKESGRVDGRGMPSVVVSGSVRGGKGEASGGIEGRVGGIATFTVNGDVVGGSGVASGTIGANQLGIVSLGGSLIGGTSSYSGQVYSTNAINNLTIAGNIRGGSATGTKDLVLTGIVRSASGRIDVMTVGGSLIAGTDTTSGVFEDNGAIRAGDNIGRLSIRGSVVGNATHAALISARGQEAPPAGSDVAIGTINVTGRVEYALIQAGIDAFGSTNADAQIGTVTVGGDWIASSLVAGAQAGADGVFGTQDDGKLSGGKDVAGVFSRISNVIIGGQVVGTESTGDHFGIVAESVGSLSIGANLIPLLAGKHNDNILLAPLIDGFFGDLRLREI